MHSEFIIVDFKIAKPAHVRTYIWRCCWLFSILFYNSVWSLSSSVQQLRVKWIRFTHECQWDWKGTHKWDTWTFITVVWYCLLESYLKMYDDVWWKKLLWHFHFIMSNYGHQCRYNRLSSPHIISVSSLSNNL